MKDHKKIPALLLAGAMLFSLVAMPPIEEAYADSKEELQQNLADTEATLEDLENKLDAVRDKKEKALDRKNLLDQRNAALQDKIGTIEEQIDETNRRIKKNEKEEKEQYELFCKQVRQEEERGTVTYWSVLFKATDFADLLSRIDFINEIMEHDQRVIAELQEVREELDQDRKDLKSQKEELHSSQKELKAQIAEAKSIVDKHTKTEEGLLEMHKAEEAEADRITDKLENFYEEHGGTGGGVEDPPTQSGLKGLIWPTNATRLITSPYGNRVSPTLGATTFHPGVDIGAPYGSSVLAAQSGTVIDAGWSGGYGICVVIAHAEGISTLYGHMSDWSVSVGQKVSRGQVIGQCGSTGISTGPHIHYEVRVNGGTINPLPYLPGYVPYDW